MASSVTFQNLTLTAPSSEPSWGSTLNDLVEELTNAKENLEQAEDALDAFKQAKLGFYQACDNLKAQKSGVQKPIDGWVDSTQKILGAIERTCKSWSIKELNSSLKNVRQLKSAMTSGGGHVEQSTSAYYDQKGTELSKSLCSFLEDLVEFGPAKIFSIPDKGKLQNDLKSLQDGLKSIDILKGLCQLPGGEKFQGRLVSELNSLRIGFDKFLENDSEILKPLKIIINAYLSFDANKKNKISRFFYLAVFSWNVYSYKTEKICPKCLMVLNEFLCIDLFAISAKPLLFSSNFDANKQSKQVLKNKDDFFSELVQNFGVLDILKKQPGFEKSGFTSDLLKAFDHFQPLVNEYKNLIDHLESVGVVSSDEDISINNQLNRNLQVLFNGTKAMQKNLLKREFDCFHAMVLFFLEKHKEKVEQIKSDLNRLREPRFQELVPFLDGFTRAVTQDSMLFFKDNFFQALEFESVCEQKVNNAWQILTRFQEDEPQSEALRKERENYNITIQKVCKVLKDGVFLPNRFAAFAYKHLERSEIFLKNRLDKDPTLCMVAAASTYFDEQSLLFALNEIYACQPTPQEFLKREFVVIHTKVVGISVFRGPKANGQEQTESRRVEQCNASCVELSKQGKVHHIYPCFIDQQIKLNNGCSTASQASGYGQVNPTLLPHLPQLKAAGGIGRNRGKGKGKGKGKK